MWLGDGANSDDQMGAHFNFKISKSPYRDEMFWRLTSYLIGGSPERVRQSLNGRQSEVIQF
jgi:hypothetical protein